LLPNYVAFVFSCDLVVGSGLGGKIRTRWVMVWVLFCHPNKTFGFEFGW
jgi:hypothetical protein